MSNLFGDPNALAALAGKLDELVAQSLPSGLRAWVAGCATGEDAYACVMLLHEAVARAGAGRVEKIFATDTDPQQLAVARTGAYPPARLPKLEPALSQYFVAVGGGQHQVIEPIRERVIFATHELLRDPPFAHLELIICRELFAALDLEQRARALERFAFALRPGGLLLLGTTPLSAGAHFHEVDRRQHLYRRSAAPARASSTTPAYPVAWPRSDAGPPSPPSSLPAVLVDSRLQLVNVGPDAERFLTIGAGAPSYNLLDLIHPDLREAARETVLRASIRGRPAESRVVQFRRGEMVDLVTIVAQPNAGDPADPGRMLIIFDGVARSEPDTPGELAEETLVAQLALLEDSNMLMSAQYDVATEELRAANEELHIVNEELRAATEELEARQEELQTLNEELVTINREQQLTLASLGQANADLQNLISSTDIGTIFLDRELQLKRYTPQAQGLFNVIPSDVGRPLAHITHQLDYPGLLDDARALLARLVTVEREVRHADGRWFLARARPYRTADNQIGGVVMTFVDISARRTAEEQLRQSYDELERRVEQRTADLAQALAARRQLLRELVHVQEAERLRIARDLHDQLGQQITAILLGLKAVQEQAQANAAILAQLEHVRGIVQALAREIHQMAVDLRPTALDDVGLAEALQGYVEGWSRRTGIEVEFFATGVERKSLPPEIETTLYRTTLEALTNIVRHAGATQVSLILERHGDTVITIVEDNGRGFDVEATFGSAQVGTHLGLLGMQERVALVGGSLSIESAPGGGTTVIVRIPLESDGGHGP